jgi:hypothetical protein
VAVASEHSQPPVLTATPTVLSIALPAAGDQRPYAAAVPMLPLVLLCVVPPLLVVLLRWAGWVRRPVWAGGRDYEPASMQFTGGAFSALVWDPMAREYHHAPGTLLPTAFRVSPRRAVVEQGNRLYNAVAGRTLAVSERIGDRLAGGDVRSYLLYIFVAVVAVLTLLALAL